MAVRLSEINLSVKQVYTLVFQKYNFIYKNLFGKKVKS